jgi:hypothetical protein
VSAHKPMEPFVVMVRDDNKRMPCYSADQIREAVERVRPPLEGLGVDEPCVEAARGALDALLHELGLDQEET